MEKRKKIAVNIALILAPIVLFVAFVLLSFADKSLENKMISDYGMLINAAKGGLLAIYSICVAERIRKDGKHISILSLIIGLAVIAVPCIVSSKSIVFSPGITIWIQENVFACVFMIIMHLYGIIKCIAKKNA